MAFIRLSLMTPKPGQAKRVEELLDRLVAYYDGRDGFIQAYRLKQDGQSGRMGRLSVWESRQHANRTATDQTDISIQSELKLACDDSTHEEHSFEGVPAAQAAAGSSD